MFAGGCHRIGQIRFYLMKTFWLFCVMCCIELSFVRSSFNDFTAKYGKDERFKGVEKMRDREQIFSDYVIELRQREKEESRTHREKVHCFMSSEFCLICWANILWFCCSLNTESSCVVFQGCSLKFILGMFSPSLSFFSPFWAHFLFVAKWLPQNKCCFNFVEQNWIFKHFFIST